MLRTCAHVLFLLASITASEASMNDQIVPGTILDPRISECGINLSIQDRAVLRPFIKTSLPLSGSVRFSAVKRSASGTSQTSQSWNFSGGTLGASQIGIDQPSTVSVLFEVKDNAGTSLCRIEQELVLDKSATDA